LLWDKGNNLPCETTDKDSKYTRSLWVKGIPKSQEFTPTTAEFEFLRKSMAAICCIHSGVQPIAIWGCVCSRCILEVDGTDTTRYLRGGVLFR